MTKKMKSAGWVVDIMRCAHLDPPAKDVAVFGINLIAPQGSTTISWPGTAIEEFTADSIREQMGSLLKPWEWTNRTWKVFGSKNGVWTLLGLAAVTPRTRPIGTAQTDALREAYWREIVGDPITGASGRTTGCKHAFSLSDDRWQGQPNKNGGALEPSIIKQSFVHALAPITHMPAGLSNDVFRFAGFLEYQSAALVSYEKLIAFPVIEFASETGQPLKFVPKDDAPIAHPVDDRAWIATYEPAFGEISLVFQSHEAPLGGGILDPEKVIEVSHGAPARDVIARLAAGHCMPLEILADALEAPDETQTPDAIRKWEELLSQDPFPQDLWTHALVRNLGAGWFRRRTDKTRLHFLQYAASVEDIEDLRVVFPRLFSERPPGDPEGVFTEPEFRTPAENRSDILRLRNALAERNQRAELAAEDVQFLRWLIDLCTDVNQPDKSKQVEQARKFLEAWRQLGREFMGDHRAEAMRAWLSVIIDREGAGADADARRRILDRLPGLIQSDCTDRLMLGAVDSADAVELWKCLDALAEIAEAFLDDENPDAEQETQTKEGAEAAKLSQWCLRRIKTILAGVREPATLSDVCNRAMAAMLEDFRAQARRRARREYDDGLLVRFDAAEADSLINDLDENIRGYAVALRSGVRDAMGSFHPDRDNAAWVTETAVLSYADERFLQEPGGAIAIMSGAVGSVSHYGQRIVQFPYKGGPIYASAKGARPLGLNDDDQDDFMSLDYRVPMTAKYPWLGLGSEFEGLCAAVDNCGGIVTRKCRDPQTLTKTLDIHALQAQGAFDGTTHLTYRSCVPPGAPRLASLQGYLEHGGAAKEDDLRSLLDLSELSDQTRALRYVSQQLQQIACAAANEGDYQVKARELVASGAIPRVACLVSKSVVAPTEPLYRTDAPSRLTFTLAPPVATKDFVRSWLATDSMQLCIADTAKRSFSDPNFKTFASRKPFDDFIDEITSKRDIAGKVTSTIEYHPAVTHVAVEFNFFGRFARELPVEIFEVKRTSVHGQQVDTVADRIPFHVKVDGASPSFVRATNTLNIPSGTFVRIRCFSLVDAKYFQGDSSDHRYFRNIAPSGAPRFGRYHGFGPLELWLESLPDWDPAESLKDFLKLDVLKPRLNNADGVQLQCTPAAGLLADWVHSVAINRHAWHWTGFPVRFPAWQQGDQLKSWLPAFAGVESNREMIDIVLPTRVGELSATNKWSGHEWSLGERRGPFVLHEHKLRAGERPSQYVTYTARVAVRFSSWLNPKLVSGMRGPKTLERKVFAAGNAIEGRGAFGESERLRLPAFEYRIPLTASYLYDAADVYRGLPLGRSVNGNLLIFKDAIRRTDSFTKAGGLGDTIEVDLLQARTLDKNLNLSQMGPNPIFHPSPASADGELPPNFLKRGIHVSEPHGFTYDLVRNAKVAQTAILVQPAVRTDASKMSVEDAPREWQLAQVRARRLILPETQLNSKLDRHGADFIVPWRRDGLERVPYDFAVDFDSGTSPNLVLDVKCGADNVSYQLTVPSFTEKNLRLRALVSFHKGRWSSDQPAHAKGTPYWAPQVHLQMREETALVWTTVAKEVCYGKAAWTLGAGEIHLTVSNATGIEAYRVQMSDYTEARWILFIGRIPGTGRQPPEEYLLTPFTERNKQRLRLARGSFDGLRGPPTQPSDWTDHKAKTSEFFVLFVSSPSSDVMTGNAGPSYHGLLAYAPVTRKEGEPVEFELMGGSTASVENANLQGSIALLCSFQHVTSPSATEQGLVIDTFTKLIDAIFPDSPKPRESLIRPTGNHWGPMRIGPAE